MSPHTGRQVDEMPMDTRKRATTIHCILHFGVSGKFTLLYVEKTLVQYSCVLGVKLLPSPQAGQHF